MNINICIKTTSYEIGNLHEISHDIYATCPCCKELCDIEYKDYVSKFPMVWCWDCLGKYVIAYPVKNFGKFLKTQIENNTMNFSLDLLKIKRIANSPSISEYCETLTGKNDAYYYDIDKPFEQVMNDVLNAKGIELNSYNIADILKTNPEYNLDHDGGNIFIEVIDLDGSLVQMKFDGD